MREHITFPRSLKKGDRVCLIDPANAFREAGIRAVYDGFAGSGLEIVLSEDIAFKHGSPAERAEKLNGIIRDPQYKGIFCIWGGYGSMTILDDLDYDALLKNRPAFVGFSDITAMHLAIQKKTGLVTYHGRMNVGEEPLQPAVRDDLLSRMEDPEKEKELCNLDRTPLEVIHPGDCKGILTGGNLTLISRLMGTVYEVDTKGKILFLEEVSEKPYRLHGMLTQLRMSGKLEKASGILLGSLTNCDDPGRPGSGLEAALDVLNQVDVPMIGNLHAGHIKDTLTLPFGKRCSFRGGKVYV